jgi:predicted porin
MKKSLLAVAAMGAFASAAQAQSSVTVYGLLDVGFQGQSTRGPVGNVGNNATTSAAFNASQTNANFTRFSGEGAQSTSRLGFRGNEDLGGGRAAFFTAEFGLNPTDNNLSGNANTGLFNRQAFVGLSQKGIGRAAIGTQYTPIHMAVGRTDPGQQNNMIGSIIYTTNGSQGSGQTATSYTVRYNNSLTLMTERMAGFQVNAIYSTNNGTANNSITGLPFNGATSVSSGRVTGSTAAGQNSIGFGQSNNDAWGAGVNYVLKKLNVDLAYQGSRNTTYLSGTQQAAGLPAATPTIGAVPTNVMGQSIAQTQMYAGAVYDFGILKAYASWIEAKAESNLNSNAYITRSGQQLGVRGNWTPKVESWASLGNGSIKGGTGVVVGTVTNVNTQNFTAWQVGSNYILSKRTNLYAIFGATQVSSSSVNASEGATSYGIGARHTF